MTQRSLDAAMARIQDGYARERAAIVAPRHHGAMSMTSKKSGPVMRPETPVPEGPPGTAELDPKVVRASIMKALGLPPAAQAVRLKEIQASVEGSKLSLKMGKDLKDCPAPAGFTPEAAQAMGPPSAMLDAQGRPVPPPKLVIDPDTPGATPEEPQRLRMKVKMVPMVVMAPCACGLIMRTPDPTCLKMAETPGASFGLPRCNCGRYSEGFTPTKASLRKARRGN